MTQYGNIGDIWRFDAPRWEKKLGPQHYLIIDIVKSQYRDLHYVCIQLETGETVPDLLIDESNMKTYNARKVA